MKRTVIVFGLISGAIISAFMGTSMALAGCSSGTDYGTMSMVIGYAAMLIAFAFVFIGIKSHRDKVLGGSISFGRGLSVGLLIAFIASTMYVVTWAVEYHYFMPDFMDHYGEHMISSIDTVGKTPEAIEALRAETTKSVTDMKEIYAQPVGFALITYSEILPLGILVALISAAILKRKPKAAVEV